MREPLTCFLGGGSTKLVTIGCGLIKWIDQLELWAVDLGLLPFRFRKGFLMICSGV
jgi:hypothetical protein